VSDQEVPVWAQELIREVTILNERLPNHIDYTQRNIADHESRIRTLEAFRWLLLGVASISGVLGSFITRMIGA
jgi:hypothetical protein